MQSWPDIWFLFRCNSCGWETPGNYSVDGAVPDTDCPKCGTHDGVVCGDDAIEAPADIEAARSDINSGKFFK